MVQKSSQVAMFGPWSFEWTQSLSEVNIKIDVNTKPVIAFKPKSMTISMGGVSVTEELFGVICTNESTWFKDRNELEIVLFKATPGEPWGHVLLSQSHSKIPENVRADLLRERFSKEHPNFDFSNATVDTSKEVPDAREFMGGFKKDILQ